MKHEYETGQNHEILIYWCALQQSRWLYSAEFAEVGKCFDHHKAPYTYGHKIGSAVSEEKLPICDIVIPILPRFRLPWPFPLPLFVLSKLNHFLPVHAACNLSFYIFSPAINFIQNRFTEITSTNFDLFCLWNLWWTLPSLNKYIIIIGSNMYGIIQSDRWIILQ